MATESASAGRAHGVRGSLFIGVACAAVGGIYVGMRWHATFERLLVPSAGNDVAETTPKAMAGATTRSSTGAAARQLWTCGMHPQVIQDHPGDCPICHMKLTPLASGGDISAPQANGPGGATTVGQSGGASVTIDPAVIQNMGVRTAVATEGPLVQTIRATATVVEAETGYRDMNLRVSGWIQTLYANTEGMEVKRGDRLFDLYSPDVRLAIEELISARRAAAASTGSGDGSMHDTAKSLVVAAENRLETFDLTREQIAELGALERAPSVVTIVSPIDGHVIDKAGVYSGSAVMAGQRVFRLSQRATMWVEARVPEREIARVKVGQRAVVKADAAPGTLFEGEVTFVNPHLDEMTRTAMVRVPVPNTDRLLREGMYATVTIALGGDQRAILIPREAIIDSGEAQVVFISVGKGRFEPRKVALGASGSDGLVAVSSGLKAGEIVVTSGQFLLDSESRLREAIAKFLGQGTAANASAGVPVAATSAPAATVPGPTVAKLAMTEQLAAKVDAAVLAYLPISEAFGDTRENDAPVDVDGLLLALRGLQADASGAEATRYITAAISATEAMRGQVTDKQRGLFKALSAAMIVLVDAMSPSPKVVDSLFVVTCPMAKAEWLQRVRPVANPYYADDMKDCGWVVRPVNGKAGGNP